MKFSAMEWYRRANMACLGGGADITPDVALDSIRPEMSNEEWLDWMDSRHMSDWTDAELQRYKELTGQVDDDPQANEPFEKENNV